MKRRRRDIMGKISIALTVILALSMLFYAAVTVVSLREAEKDAVKLKAEGEKKGEAFSEQEDPATSASEEAASTAPAPETAVRDESVIIGTVSSGELQSISQEYDMTPRGFGTNGERDENNRPVNVNDFVSLFDGNEDASVRCYCSDPQEKKVSFTFQAGMENGYTGQVMDILRDYRVKSTFYLSHYYAANNMELVQRMISEGHEVGNHSYTCPDAGIATLSLEEQMTDAMNLQNFVTTAYGYKMTKYNFNSSIWSPASVILMSRMGYEVCFFSMNYSDYDVNASYDPDETLKILKEGIHNGCVYCFHMTNPITVQILPALIEYCQTEGYIITQLP